MIVQPYLLVLNIALHRHDGRYWADPLWKKDLEAHRVGIGRLSIACPVVKGAPPRQWQPIAVDIAVHPLPPMGRSAPLLIPLVVGRLWRATSGAAIVHTGVAGWPYPLGWLAIPIARLRRRRIVLMVESAFWRIAPGMPASRLARLRSAIWEWVNVRATRASDISFFTTHSYMEDLHAGGPRPAHVLPAVWIDDEQLIQRDRLAELAVSRQGRLLFAGRLTAAKGLQILLDAVEMSGVGVDVIGEGELREAVLAASRRSPHLVKLLDPVEYGPAFVALLDGYAGLVVPTVSDEQPRVIFDAFARGVAVLASATTGNRQIVEDGHNGLLFAAGDAAALAAALTVAREDPVGLATMGTTAWREMAGRTHAAMHAERAGLIAAMLSSASDPG